MSTVALRYATARRTFTVTRGVTCSSAGGLDDDAASRATTAPPPAALKVAA